MLASREVAEALRREEHADRTSSSRTGRERAQARGAEIDAARLRATDTFRFEERVLLETGCRSDAQRRVRRRDRARGRARAAASGSIGTWRGSAVGSLRARCRARSRDRPARDGASQVSGVCRGVGDCLRRAAGSRSTVCSGVWRAGSRRWTRSPRPSKRSQSCASPTTSC